MNLNKIVSPTLLLNKDICLKNIRQMSEKAKANNIIFRPHFKTHQSAAIGDWFRKFNINKITVSSVQMAEYFARNNWKDITIAFPVNIREIEGINNLAEEIQLNLTVENLDSILFLEKKLKFQVKYYIKIDAGYHRTGIDVSNYKLINQILDVSKNSSKLHFAGFLSHFGNTYNAKNKDNINQIYSESINDLNILKNNYISDYPELILSIGDTPSCSVVTDFSWADEIRPGNFVFYDLMQHYLGSCDFDKIAVCLACPIVAIHAERNEIIIHGGAIHFSKEYITIDGLKIYGQLVFLTEKGWQKPDKNYYLTKLTQEHGTIIADMDLIQKLKIGELIGIIPVHSCLTANLMKGYYITDNEWIDHLTI